MGKYLFSGLVWPFILAASSFAQPAVDKAHFQLFLLAGQSNMAGRGAIEPPDLQTNPRIWVLNKNNAWQLAAAPLHFDKPGIAGVGPGMAFASRLLQLDTSLVIGLVPCAVGGSPIEVWEPGKFYAPTKSHPYDDAVQRAQAAMQYGTFRGILWHQGESDADSARAPLYAERLAVLIQRFRQALGQKKLPFLAGTLAGFYTATHPFGNMINAAITSLQQTIKNMAVVSAAGLMPNSDQVHFNTAAARTLGQRYAETYYALYGNK